MVAGIEFFETYFDCCFEALKADEHEYRLIGDLLRNYNSFSRPIKNHRLDIFLMWAFPGFFLLASFFIYF